MNEYVFWQEFHLLVAECLQNRDKEKVQVHSEQADALPLDANTQRRDYSKLNNFYKVQNEATNSGSRRLWDHEMALYTHRNEYLQAKKKRKQSSTGSINRGCRKISREEYTPEELNTVTEILAAAERLLSTEEHKLFLRTLVSYSDRHLDACALVQRSGEILVAHPSLLSSFKNIVQRKYRKYLETAKHCEVVQMPSTASTLLNDNQFTSGDRVLPEENVPRANEIEQLGYEFMRLHTLPKENAQIVDEIRYWDARLIVERLGRLRDTNRQLYEALSVTLRRFQKDVTVPEHVHRCLCILLEDESELLNDIVSYTGFPSISRNEYPSTARNLVLKYAKEVLQDSESNIGTTKLVNARIYIT